MKNNKELIRRIMLLSHELGQELSVKDVVSRAKRLCKHLREEKDLEHADIEYTLYYMREILEKKYEEKYGKK